ncbi:hypothetical protein NYF23_07090 [SAR92 clade bacterium H455]|uniref:Uncharacterized protein n=1 Tax=SAR92 clade bacterium H455 TaxID=2974818 RepID=A0ABY5TKB7_9GAMM|nr:hypothetical protein NYF23_07090 [SAR92 clade bacterium H455]
MQTAEGRFIDAVVEGLSFTSGDQTGVTDSEGTFVYEVGQNITFSVGAVEIGTAAGSDIISPVDLTGSNSTMPDTQNIVRFLLMLDSDGDSSNGITISNEVQLMAENWTQPDFTTDLLDGELASIIADVMAVDNRIPVLPSAMEAQAHLEGTLACLTSGVFKGTFSGQDNGTFLLWVQHERFDPLVFGDDTPRVGVTSALVFSTDENLVSGVAPQQGLSFDSEKLFISGLVSTGAEFTGELVDYQTITNGSWQNSIFNESGTFSGERLAGGEGAVYRLSGFFNLQGFGFTADDSGLVALDIMTDNSVTGVMVTLRGDETPLTGTRTGNDITVSGGGNSFSLSFDPDGSDSANDLALGTTSGFLGTMTGASGTSDVIGTSCQPD